MEIWGTRKSIYNGDWDFRGMTVSGDSMNEILYIVRGARKNSANKCSYFSFHGFICNLRTISLEGLT